ncbi:hypothetical protein D9758_003843 [Tetrapyrgos nigripes]|uniref:Reverse transcriptase domain-containing protein n=1 Tax=Tetrapyrgos nigripes TaxID=182062 RepID=A0A8H5LRS9_9AGAR|nr:hypothetical protein D9758_003843 [Tetrapyrgos nigripes]
MPILQWAQSQKLILPSQNGFQKGCQTTNNIFILCLLAMEKAKSMGNTLWVAGVSLKDAFPSVHCATVWLKLKQLGTGGKIFDLLWLIYREMKYKVQHGDFLSDKFTSLSGILAGDTCSPLLWILYFSDFGIPQSADGIELFSEYILHLEQVDDLLLLVMLPEGLQQKMNLFYNWCKVNFMVINALKSFIVYHGPAPDFIPIFLFDQDIVPIVEDYVYVRMKLHSGNFLVFSSVAAPHYENKAAKAHSVAHSILHIESMIGILPLEEGKLLYTACVDPHLILMSTSQWPTHSTRYKSISSEGFFACQNAPLLSQCIQKLVLYQSSISACN